MLFSSFQDVNSKDIDVVKSLFIYNFTKHIEWPSQKMASPKFEIAIYGKSSIVTKLTAISMDRKVLDKAIEIKVIENIDDAFNCNILFIAGGQGEKLNSLLDKCNGKSILIITEEKKMNLNGVCINIFEKDSHIRFELNTAIIKKEGFKVSNQLYELASVTK